MGVLQVACVRFVWPIEAVLLSCAVVFEQLLLHVAALLFGLAQADVLAVGLHLPCFFGVGKGQVEGFM